MQRVRIGDLEVDASLSEKHSDRVEITRHPVEEGTDITDHVRILPQQLVVEGLLTNTPANAQEAKDEGTDRTKPFAHGRALDGYAALRDMLKAGDLITVSTALREYPNMLLISLEVPADASTGDAVKFSATFNEIRFVKTEEVSLEALSHPNKVPSKPVKKNDKGKKAPEEKPPEQLRSVLKSTTDATGVTKAGDSLRIIE